MQNHSNYRNNPIEVTIWKEKARLIEPEDSRGKALAVTAMTVTVYNSYKLGSTVSTTVELHPDIPELQAYLDK